MSDLIKAAREFQAAITRRRVVARFVERYGMEHPSEEARKNYLKDHPNAEPRNHTVQKSNGGGGGSASATGQLTSQMSAMVKKIDGIDAGSKSSVEKHVGEIASLGSKLEKQLEKLDGKVDSGKLNRAIEHAQAVSSLADKLKESAGDEGKVDKLLGSVQAELNGAMKLLR